jgi:hypothetical protein
MKNAARQTTFAVARRYMGNAVLLITLSASFNIAFSQTRYVSMNREHGLAWQRASKSAPAKPKGNTNKSECWQRVAGQIGYSEQWGSGWLQLSTVSDFKRGERLRLLIGGSAQKVVIRLLSKGESPDGPSGVFGTFNVPPDRYVVATLDGDYQNVFQLSVHGGPRPWNMFPLGGGNGPATLIKADIACH